MKKSVALLWIMLLLSSLPIVDAAWQETGRSGTWILDQPTHWKTDDAEGWQAYEIGWDNTGLVNFTQWSFLTKLWGYGRGSMFTDTDMEQRAVFTLRDNDSITTIELEVWYQYQIELWGLHYDSAGVQLFVNGSKEASWYPAQGHYEYPIVRAWFFQDSAKPNTLKVQVRMYYPDGAVTFGFDRDITVGQDWFNEVDLLQEVHAWGHGWMEGIKGEEAIKTNIPGEGTDEPIPTGVKSLLNDLAQFVKSTWDAVKEAMPQPIKDFMTTLEIISGVVWTTMWLTYAIVVGLLPLLGVILGFYFLQVGLQSVYEESTEPLMQAVNRFYSLLVGYVNAAINIIKTIWGFIKFW